MADRLFPASPRYHYERAPLVQVVCQLRFPPILRIEAEPPAAFQERIRAIFPLVEQVGAVNLPGAQIPPEMLQMLAATVKFGGYQFLKEDRATQIALTND